MRPEAVRLSASGTPASANTVLVAGWSCRAMR
ncbi:ABC transporter ATP-binding protein [Bordetella pertussis]|nr:ABC transporter ATP-binding protein [Bordetella pertussis]